MKQDFHNTSFESIRTSQLHFPASWTVKRPLWPRLAAQATFYLQTSVHSLASRFFTWKWRLLQAKELNWKNSFWTQVLHPRLLLRRLQWAGVFQTSRPHHQWNTNRAPVGSATWLSMGQRRTSHFMEPSFMPTASSAPLAENLWWISASKKNSFHTARNTSCSFCIQPFQNNLNSCRKISLWCHSDLLLQATVLQGVWRCRISSCQLQHLSSTERFLQTDASTDDGLRAPYGRDSEDDCKGSIPRWWRQSHEERTDQAAAQWTQAEHHKCHQRGTEAEKGKASGPQLLSAVDRWDPNFQQQLISDRFQRQSASRVHQIWDKTQSDCQRRTNRSIIFAIGFCWLSVVQEKLKSNKKTVYTRQQNRYKNCENNWRKLLWYDVVLPLCVLPFDSLATWRHLHDMPQTLLPSIDSWMRVVDFTPDVKRESTPWVLCSCLEWLHALPSHHRLQQWSTCELCPAKKANTEIFLEVSVEALAKLAKERLIESNQT